MTRRADRLFAIIQALRRARAPLTAEMLAEQLEVSRRTIYRDVATLVGERVPLRGEAGTGYVLERGFELPPLAFSPDELAAVVLGAAWVEQHADTTLARAAESVLAKVRAAVPESHADLLDGVAVAVPPRLVPLLDERVDVTRLRAASREGHKLSLAYQDAEGRVTERIIWPFLIGYHEDRRGVIAWCELRGAFRVFRLDRILDVTFLEESFPESPAILRQRYLDQLGQ